MLNNTEVNKLTLEYITWAINCIRIKSREILSMVNFGLYSQNHIIIYLRENSRLFPRIRVLVVSVDWCWNEYLVICANLLCDPWNEKKKKWHSYSLYLGNCLLPQNFGSLTLLESLDLWCVSFVRQFPWDQENLKKYIGNESLIILPGWRVRGKLFWVTVITVKIERQQAVFQQIILLYYV